MAHMEATSGRLERKKEETRRRIVDTAIGLFRRHGFESTTMEQIAEEADIAKGTLYHYFPTKEAIVVAYIQRTMQERNAGRIERLREMPDTRSRLERAMIDLMEGVQEQRDLFEKFLAYRVQRVVSLRPDRAEGETRNGLAMLAVEIIRLGQSSGEIRADLPPDMLIDLFEFVFVEVAKAFYMQPETFDLPTTAAQAAGLFLGGAGTQND